MQPIFGFGLYIIACLVVAVIASKRGRSGWAFFFVCLLVGPMLVVLISSAGGSGLAAGFGVFLVPIAGFMIALSTKTASDMALAQGEFGDFKKCPFCAEAVRREAVKCKHCGSDLGPGSPVEPSASLVRPAMAVLDSEDMECVECKKHIPKTAVACAYCGHSYKARAL